MPIENKEILPLELVHAQLKEVLLGKMNIDTCAIPQGYSNVPDFAINKQRAIFARVGHMFNLNGRDDRVKYYDLCFDLVNFMNKNKSSQLFNLEIAEIVCDCLIMRVDFSSRHSMLFLLRQENSWMLADQYIQAQETKYIQCDKLARDLLEEFNQMRQVQPLTFSVALDSKSLEAIKNNEDDNDVNKKVSVANLKLN